MQSAQEESPGFRHFDMFPNPLDKENQPACMLARNSGNIANGRGEA